MKSVKKIFILLFLSFFSAIAANGKKDIPETYISDGYNTWKTADNKNFKLCKREENRKPNPNHIPCFASQKLDDGRTFLVTENNFGYEDFIFYDEKIDEDTLIYSVHTYSQIYDAYLVNDNIYCCDSSGNNKVTLKKRTIYSQDVVQEYYFDFGDIRPESNSLRELYVDEENDRALLLCWKNEPAYSYDLKVMLHICSLSKCERLYSIETSTQFTSRVGNQIYYSYDDELYILDYTAKTFFPQKIETFVKEEYKEASLNTDIINIQKQGDYYFVLIEWWKNGMWGTYPTRDYYLCTLEDNKLKKISKLEQ